MKAKHALALAGVVLCGALALFLLQRDTGTLFLAGTGPDATRSNRFAAPAAIAPSVSIVSPDPEVSSVTEHHPVAPTLPSSAKETPAPQTQVTPPKKGKDPIKDPLAREALAWVGFDEEAEVYWVEAINDPSLPAEERQDLIEDLNEDGISDPKHPTLQDLPLILNRLAIIELLAPDAMDQVNADAFMEAYKDLINLAQVAVGAGEPVK